jgi:hypothetical protein
LRRKVILPQNPLALTFFKGSAVVDTGEGSTLNAPSLVHVTVNSPPPPVDRNSSWPERTSSFRPTRSGVSYELGGACDAGIATIQ